MKNLLTTVLYCKAIEDSLRYVTIDKDSGEKREFKKLFYPVRIDEGKYAFELFRKRVYRSDDGDNKGQTTKIEVKEKILTGQSQLQLSDLTSTNTVNGSENPESKVHRAFPNLQESQFNDSTGSQIKAKISRHTVGIIQSRETPQDVDETSSSISLMRYLPKSHSGRASWDNLVHSKTRNLSEENCDILTVEPDEDKKRRVLWTDSSTGYPSRVIAMASAGYGKTTLLNRIALFYCYCQRENEIQYEEYRYEQQFREQYDLPMYIGTSETYIPCLIRLRDINYSNQPLGTIIREAVEAMIPEYDIDSLGNWINSIKDRILLLIDGLDEMPDGKKADFLQALDNYLEINPSTAVVLSSRVAGLSENNVSELLRKMRFHGRTIMPLSDEDAERYCIQWILATQDDDLQQRESYLRMISDIQNQKRYEYLKEFMRTPLELTIIVRQIIRNSISRNKWDLFHDLLWEQFTNHIEYNEKQRIFDDTMLFLSYIAFYLQENDSLYFTMNDLAVMLEKIQSLNFQTAEFIELSCESIWNKLEYLAANIGIIEKDDTQDKTTFTFPIRAYQEFLASYACCHICMNVGEPRPNPANILIQHINDSRWMDVIAYALSDMENNGILGYESFKSDIFQQCSNIDLMIIIVENGFYIDYANATVICRKHFGELVLPEYSKELLKACLNCGSAYSFRKALVSLYKKTFMQSPWLFHEALSYAYLYRAISENKAIVDYSMSLLASCELHQQLAGAGMLALMARIVLKEDSVEEGHLFQESMNEDVIQLLYDAANRSRSYIFIETLSELWLSRIDGTEGISKHLDGNMLGIIQQEITSIPLFQWCSNKRLENSMVKFLEKLYYVVGSFPVNSLSSSKIKLPFWHRVILDYLYSESKDDFEINQVSLAVARMHLGGSIEQFMTSWIWDICKGRPSSQIRKDSCSLREKNQFTLMRHSISDKEKQYRSIISDQANVFMVWQNRDRTQYGFLSRNEKKRSDNGEIEAQQTDDPFSILVSDAIDHYCLHFGNRDDAIIENIVSEVNSGHLSSNAATNLAFLIRNGQLNTASSRYDRTALLYRLLANGVANLKPYAIINLALYEIEIHNYCRALSLLSKISTNGWRDAVHNWWYPQLWTSRKTCEGALVCVLAQKYAGIQFPEYDEMLQMITADERLQLNIGNTPGYN